MSYAVARGEPSFHGRTARFEYVLVIVSNRSQTMPNRYSSSESPSQNVGATMGERVVSRANEATESISDAVSAATDKVNEGRETAADRLEGAASTVHERADQLPGGPTVKEFAHAAADRLSSTADYVRTHDATRMMADIESVVKKNPGPALVVAAAFGFILGQALSRNE
jgi:ElaB/YqjD/DUF883 family membrane-anchored ribosome-binding protein